MKTCKLSVGEFQCSPLSSTYTKVFTDLPGHQDEVYAVDWSPDGQKVGSGGKDKAIRIWRH
jgi:WD40 repeat protein